MQKRPAALRRQTSALGETDYAYDAVSRMCDASVQRVRLGLHVVPAKNATPNPTSTCSGPGTMPSSMGRFMIPDWAAKPTNVPYASFGNPQSLNLYSYVNNNPHHSSGTRTGTVAKTLASLKAALRYMSAERHYLQSTAAVLSTPFGTAFSELRSHRLQGSRSRIQSVRSVASSIQTTAVRMRRHQPRRQRTCRRALPLRLRSREL